MPHAISEDPPVAAYADARPAGPSQVELTLTAADGQPLATLTLAFRPALQLVHTVLSAALEAADDTTAAG